MSGGSSSLGEYFSITAYPEPYCGFVMKMTSACFEMSILELWANEGSYDNVAEETIANLTKESILVIRIVLD